MKVAISCEASSYALKEAVKAHLTSLGYEMIDVGAQSPDDTIQYYESAAELSRRILKGEAERGIAMCGTGTGASLVCNAYKGIHCVCCESIYTAEKIGLINNANVLAMGSQTVSNSMGCQMAEKYLAGKWCDGFDAARKARNVNGYNAILKIEAEGDC